MAAWHIFLRRKKDIWHRRLRNTISKRIDADKWSKWHSDIKIQMTMQWHNLLEHRFRWQTKPLRRQTFFAFLYYYARKKQKSLSNEGVALPKNNTATQMNTAKSSWISDHIIISNSLRFFFLRYAKIEYKIILLLKSRLIFWDKVLQAVAREICFLYENNLDLSLARNIFM